MDTSELPSLFGRFSALHRDHEQLDQLVRRLAEMCEVLTNCLDCRLAPELAPERLIAEWSVRLSQHFAAEEGIRYFGTLAADRPALVGAIGDLRADHAAMLEAIERLVSLAPDQMRREELVLGTRDLIDHFRRHERAETRLLQEFFDTYARAEP